MISWSKKQTWKTASVSENAMGPLYREVPFFFAGLALIFSLSLYLAPIFDHIPGSMEPELAVLYTTTTFLLISLLPFISKFLVKEASTVLKKEVVAGLTALSGLHAAVVGLGYAMVDRNTPPLWLVGLNLGACIGPGTVYFLKRQEVGEKRKDD